MTRRRSTASLRSIATAVVIALTACSPDATQIIHTKAADASPSGSASLASQDRDFLEQAVEGNNAEVAMGTLGRERAEHPEVAAFAAMMVSDHGAANQRLAVIAVARHIALPTSLGEQQAGFDRVAALYRQPLDRAFLQVMIGAHQNAVELFKSEASNGVDPELKAFAAATLPAIEGHLARAQALAALASPTEDTTSPPTPDATVPPSPTSSTPLDQP